MKVYCSKRILLSLYLMMAIYLLLSPFQALAQDNPSAQPDQTVEPASSAEVDSHLAGMSDEQIRQAYAQKLKQEAQKRSASTSASEKRRPLGKIRDSFYGAAKAAAADRFCASCFNF